MTEAGSNVWDFETDVVIVGSGAGGLCAGLTVNAEGRASLIIEKNSTVGGASVVSGGVIWVPNNRSMREHGVPDDEESGYTYMRSLIKTSGLATSDSRVRAFLRAGPETLDFVASEGVPLQMCYGYSDYEDDQPGGVPLDFTGASSQDPWGPGHAAAKGGSRSAIRRPKEIGVGWQRSGAGDLRVTASHTRQGNGHWPGPGVAKTLPEKSRRKTVDRQLPPLELGTRSPRSHSDPLEGSSAWRTLLSGICPGEVF